MLPVKHFCSQFCVMLLAAVLLSSCAAFDIFKGGSNDEKSGQPEPAIVDAKDAQMASLENKIVLLEDKISILESQVADQKKVGYTVEYSDPARLYKKARTLFLAKNYKDAADLFSTFANAHAGHALADNAMYWMGECYYTPGQYKKAATVFKGLVKTYPKAEKVPDALLKTGYAYLFINDFTRAAHYLNLVISKHPFSPAAEKAQKKLSEFQ